MTSDPKKQSKPALDGEQPIQLDQPPKASKVSFLQMRLRAGYNGYSRTIFTRPDGTTLH